MRSTGWLALVAVVFSAFIAVAAYNAGLSQGAAETAAAAGNALPPYAYGWGWYRPWGFGFGFPIFFFLIFWLLIARGLCWGGPWRRRWHYDGDVPHRFEEWHRRAHEKMPSDKTV
jgi:hypothetical protein